MPISTLSTSRPLTRTPGPGRGTDPTADETEFVSWLNAARANPEWFGRRVGVDLGRVRAADPVAIDTRLTRAARRHAEWMAATGLFAHNGSGGDPGRQIAAVGFSYLSWGQSIAAGYRDPLAALDALVVDRDVTDRTHRRHLLAIDRVYRGQVLVGVGVARGGPHGTYCVVNTAAPSPKDAGAASAPRPVTDEVRDLFCQSLGRTPDESESRFYCQALAAGCPAVQVLARLLSSEEALERFGTPEAWVRRLYASGLGRPPARDELAEAAGLVARCGHRTVADHVLKRAGSRPALARPPRRGMMTVAE